MTLFLPALFSPATSIPLAKHAIYSRLSAASFEHACRQQLILATSMLLCHAVLITFLLVTAEGGRVLNFVVYAGGLCAAADNKVQCFSLDTSAQPLKLSATLEVKQQGIADICIRQDQRLFATAGWDGKIRMFHYKKRKALAILQVSFVALLHSVYVGCWRWHNGASQTKHLN